MSNATHIVCVSIFNFQLSIFNFQFAPLISFLPGCWMLLSFTHRFIFIHVYKVAGTSVVAALEPFAHQPEKLLANRVLGKLNSTLGTSLSLPGTRHKIFPDHIRAAELRDSLPDDLYK